MKTIKKIAFPVLIAAATFLLPACKAKKPVQAPPPPPPVLPVEVPKTVPVAPDNKQPEPVQQVSAPTPPPDYNFSNIQFEFNSAVLKTGAYTILDKAVAEMKKDLTVNFALNGYASAEGSPAHNLSLSEERANSVKTYLVNSGISASRISTKGYGEANPINKGTDEASRAVNRRVEIKK